MKRKTNLFYTGGQDSKFLTFSNYTEVLTGNFLSTNTKLFPSTFVCLNVPSLTPTTKDNFIKKTLVAYYENKLACLRDYFDSENTSIEDAGVAPLEYLLEAIKEYDPSASIVYIGNVTEQDWNGTYTDTICIIDSSVQKTLNVSYENTPSGYYTYDADYQLNGWLSSELPSSYSDVEAECDDDNSYYTISTIDSMSVVDRPVGTLEFNIVIPLFSLVNVDYRTNTHELTPESNSEFEASYNINCPLGIWFADNTITLNIDDKYSQSWSLTIGSQFKPFPYSSRIHTDIEGDNSTQAFATFAQILAKLNTNMEEFKKINKEITELNNQLNAINSRLSEIPSTTSLDEMRTVHANDITNINIELNSIKAALNDRFNLNWKEIN